MASSSATALFALLLVSLATQSHAWKYNLNPFINWCNDNGYTEFVRAISSTHLPATLLKLLDNGQKLTILVPNNQAFWNYKNSGDQCACIPLDTTLSLHVLSGFYTAKQLSKDNIGTLYPTGTAVPVAKKSNWPLRFGVQTGFLVWLSSTKVVYSNAFQTKDGLIIVHIVDSVLPYPYKSRFY